MKFTTELQGRDVVVYHPNWTDGPKLLAGWSWHAELVRQLIAERDAFRATSIDADLERAATIDALAAMQRERDQLQGTLELLGGE